jgi:hypothetical protein
MLPGWNRVPGSGPWKNLHIYTRYLEPSIQNLLPDFAKQNQATLVSSKGVPTTSPNLPERRNVTTWVATLVEINMPV